MLNKACSLKILIVFLLIISSLEKNFTFTKKPVFVNYRGDFYGTLMGKTHIIEVKNVICATYNPSLKLTSGTDKFYDSSKPFSRSGIYPFGNKTQK